MTEREVNGTVGSVEELTREKVVGALRQSAVKHLARARDKIAESRENLANGDGSTKEEDELPHILKETEVKNISEAQAYALQRFIDFLDNVAGEKPRLVDEGSVFVYRLHDELEAIIVAPRLPHLQTLDLQEDAEKQLGMPAFIVFVNCTLFRQSLKGAVLREGAEIVTKVTGNPDVSREVIRVL